MLIYIFYFIFQINNFLLAFSFGLGICWEMGGQGVLRFFIVWGIPGVGDNWVYLIIYLLIFLHY